MLGKDLNGRQYDYDGPYFPQYRPARTHQMYINGRLWIKRMELGPWTRYDRVTGQTVTVQGDHHSVWTFSSDGRFAAVKHTSREVNAPRHDPKR
jgi:hypothetical protein